MCMYPFAHRHACIATRALQLFECDFDEFLAAMEKFCTGKPKGEELIPRHWWEGWFRRDHGDEVTRDASRCAKCHTAVSGASRDVCDECHRVMRPSDHVVSWREYDHGPDAALFRHVLTMIPKAQAVPRHLVILPPERPAFMRSK